MQRLGVPPIQSLLTSSKNEDGSETMKVLENVETLRSVVAKLSSVVARLSFADVNMNLLHVKISLSVTILKYSIYGKTFQYNAC